MDRRQQKTREAIFRSFSDLLEHHRYEHITVQEIIDKANIGRSTFYAHFETKDELLRAMCTDIFQHVFADNIPKEENHDFYSGSEGLEKKLAHVLHHLKENRGNLNGLLKSESSTLFMRYFKEYLCDLFQRYIGPFRANVPSDYMLHHLVGSFSETVTWWVAENMVHTPEEVARCYITVTGMQPASI